MPYTLMKGLAWILVAVVLGLIIGWLLRSVAARRQVARAGSGDEAAEIERLRRRIAELESAAADRERATASAPLAATAPPERQPPLDDPADASTASTVLGRTVVIDDLTVVEGIDADIAELCRGIGITTWAELSATESSLLRTMLDDAGPHDVDHDPTTWPHQARLLAAGSWAEFRALSERLRGGRDGG